MSDWPAWTDWTWHDDPAPLAQAAQITVLGSALGWSAIILAWQMLMA